MSDEQSAEIYSHLEGGGRLAITSVHRANQDLPLVDRLIEPQTIAHFFSACCEGTLPNGKAVSLELLKGTELPLLRKSPTTDNDERDIITRVMSRIGSVEDDARMCIVGRNIWSVKNRLWAGMIPLSEQRWKEKGLDQPDNFDTAAQYLSAVVAVFEYLNRPKVQENIRDTFNLISQHLGEFETIVNAEREEGQPRLNMRQLWTEYIKAHFEVITERAHRWVLVHVNALREPLVRDIVTYRPADLDSPDRLQWKITDRLHILAEIAGAADYTIMLPMHGYYGYTTPSIPDGVLPSLRAPNWTVRRKAYGPYLKTLSRIQQVQDILDRRGRDEYHVADPVAFQRTTEIQLGCQQRARREIRGEPVEPVPKEPWITDVLSRQMETDEHRVGFVVYRLTYEQTEADWYAFREKFEAHLSDWGMGQTGSAALKPHLTLHWRDGKELGIPADDIEAAKKHYLNTYTDSADHPLILIDHINQRVFLAVDTPSYASYTSSAYTASTSYVHPGDFTGFILAVDTEFDPQEGPERPDETPGFFGQLRILGSLVWGDLFGMLASQCAILEDLWPLAIDHPDQVYAGPLVPLVVKSWRVHNGIRGILMNQIMEYVKARVEGRPWPVTNTPTGSSSHRANTNTTITTHVNNDSDGGSGNNSTLRTPRQFPPELVPPANPREDGIRRLLMFEFARYLRRNGQTEQAIIVEQMLRAPRGELPDVDEVQRRMELEGIRPGETRFAPPPSQGQERGNGQGQGQGQVGDEDGCPMQ
ncbi:hypothetical protein BDW72DRAFT_166808 [Aspergillus terricola var. indicus]